LVWWRETVGSGSAVVGWRPMEGRGPSPSWLATISDLLARRQTRRPQESPCRIVVGRGISCPTPTPMNQAISYSSQNAPGSLRAGRLRSPPTPILHPQIPAISSRCRRRHRRWWRCPGRQMAEGMVGAPHCLLYARRGGGFRGRGEASWPVGGRRFSGPRGRWRRGGGVLRRWRCPLAEGSLAAARATSGPDLGPAGCGRCKLGQFVAVYAVATEVGREGKRWVGRWAVRGCAGGCLRPPLSPLSRLVLWLVA
jgi:hypothetical protein